MLFLPCRKTSRSSTCWPGDPICARCGGKLTYSTQAEHDADHAGAERILALVAEAGPDDWIMGAENHNALEYGNKEIDFLPASSFGRKQGSESCGHQLFYSIGGYWPRSNVIKRVTVDEALQAGMIPWSALFRRIDSADSRWPATVDAMMRLPIQERRELLLGHPIPKGMAARHDSCNVERLHPEQFWRRDGSMPIKGWTEAGGGFLHIPAYDVIRSLSDHGQLEDCLPEKSAIFRAFDLVRSKDVKVVILGQDPYPAPEDAMGLAFSSPAAKLPASLRNIYKELIDDLGCPAPFTGNLTPWAHQGVLLANTALTLGADGRSHLEYWQTFTETWIKALASTRPVVWILWGNHARQWKLVIESQGGQHQVKHAIIESAHPSPLSARRGFFGSKPFSKANEALAVLGIPQVKWSGPA